MTAVRISFHGYVKDVIPVPEGLLDLPERFTLRDLLQTIGHCYGYAALHRLTTSDGGIRNLVQLFLNGEQLDKGNLDAPLSVSPEETDEISLYVLTAASGG